MKINNKSIPIKGMHCKSCTIVVGDELRKLPGVKHASVSLRTNEATISYEDEPTQIQVEKAVAAAGYFVGYNKQTYFSRDKSTYFQFVYSLAFLVVVLLVLRGLGFSGINLDNLGDNKGTMALIVGVTAGFSTCMALVGGLVLGLSSRYAETHQSATVAQRFRPHLFFNLGRIITFFTLGGVIGLFGSVIKLDSQITGLMTIVIGFVMIILGLQLTELFPRLANKGVTLPAGIARLIGLKQHRQKEYSHKNALILGGLTFFLPCGFTQAMQLVAIASGNWLTGAIVMGLFAIGTAPGLLGVGGLTSILKGKFAKIFFRFAGVVVLLLAVYNIGNGLNLAHVNLFSSTAGSDSTVIKPVDSNATVLKTTFTPSGGTQDISPSTFNVQVGKSYTLEVDAKGDGRGCMSTIMIPGVYDNPLLISKGKISMPFVVDKPGTYNITCAMGIVRGTITATTGGSK